MSTSIDNDCGQIEMPLLKREAAADAADAAAAAFCIKIVASFRKKPTYSAKQLELPVVTAALRVFPIRNKPLGIIYATLFCRYWLFQIETFRIRM